jgi:hypothetical protein
MIRNSLLFLCTLLLLQTVHAQESPWAKLPMKKQVLNTEGEEIFASLVIDSIYQRSTDEKAKVPGNFFYKSDVDLIGYGYKDTQGNPYGVWRYYNKLGNKYQLRCEGYYKVVAPVNLEVEPDIILKFPISNTVAAKENFISSLSDKLFFTGEWRFYKGDHLEKIIQLDDKVQLPYQLSVALVSQNYDPAKDQTATQLNILEPVNRLAANMIMQVQFSTSGTIEYIYSPSLRLEFDPSGKAKMEPLQDL